MNEQEAKSSFAAELLRHPGNPFAAAQAVFGSAPEAFRISVEWLNDPYVVARKRDLLNELGEEGFLPSKAELAHLLLDAANEKNYSGAYRHELKDRTAALRVIAEMLGYMPKAGVSVNVNNTVGNRVMVVPAFVSDDAWERGLEVHQRKLIENARSTSH
jgi:hypothetical protein